MSNNCFYFLLLHNTVGWIIAMLHIFFHWKYALWCPQKKKIIDLLGKINLKTVFSYHDWSIQLLFPSSTIRPFLSTSLSLSRVPQFTGSLGSLLLLQELNLFGQPDLSSHQHLWFTTTSSFTILFLIFVFGTTPEIHFYRFQLIFVNY